MLKLKEFQEELRSRVIGQEDAVKTVSTAIFKYIMKLNARDFGQNFKGATSVLLLGPSGSGKTYIAQQASEIMDIPYIEINAKSITQEGWHGRSFLDQVESGIAQATYEYGRSVKGALIFLDEFDKLTMPNVSSKSEDVNYHLQASLLKYIEGMVAQTQRGHIEFNNCMFILAGAFVGLEIDPPETIGFTSNKGIPQSTIKALIDYGVLPELVGRIQEISILKKLTREDYIEITNSHHFIINKWMGVLEKFDIDLKWNIDDLIRHAEETDLGARGLIQAVELLITSLINANIDKIDLEKFSPLWSTSGGRSGI